MFIVSRFCKIPDKYYSISSFNLFDTAQDYFKKGSIGSNKGSSLWESEYDEPLNISGKLHLNFSSNSLYSFIVLKNIFNLMKANQSNNFKFELKWSSFK